MTRVRLAWMVALAFGAGILCTVPFIIASVWTFMALACALFVVVILIIEICTMNGQMPFRGH